MFDKSPREWTTAIAKEAESVLIRHFGDRLSVRRGDARYSDTAAEVRFSFARKDSDGVPLTMERENFVRFAPLHGLSEDDFGQTFMYQGERFEIVGWNARAKKYPVEATRQRDGRRMRFHVETVKTALPEPRSAHLRDPFKGGS